MTSMNSVKNYEYSIFNKKNKKIKNLKNDEIFLALNSHLYILLNPHPSFVIYEGVCYCQDSYIGVTVRNVEIRWQEPEGTPKDSEPAKYLKNNPTHSFTWKVLLPASSIRRIRQSMEASIPSLKYHHLMNKLSLRNFCYLEMVSLDNLSFSLQLCK